MTRIFCSLMASGMSASEGGLCSIMYQKHPRCATIGIP